MEKKKYRLNHQLLKRRPHFFLIGLVISMSALLVAFEWTKAKKKIVLPAPQVSPVTIDILPPVTFPKKAEAKKAEPIQKVDRSRLATQPVVVFASIESKEVNLSESAAKSFPVSQLENDSDFDEEMPVEEYVPTWKLSRLPEFPGGEQERMRYLADNLHYPVVAKRFKKIGTVFIAFVVDTEGSISDVKIIKGVSPDLDAEALRVVKAMPRWIPGRQGTKKVKVRYVQKIEFKLL